MESIERSSMYIAHAPRSPMAAILDMAARIGAAGAHAAVSGASGTGKETIARLIHAAGAARDEGFRVVECAGRSADELELELFGRATLPAAGTVLLNDVGELPPGTQARLVRWLDESSAGAVRRIRFIGASTDPLLKDVSSGRFRRDLYDALACAIHVPPLRERPDDVLHVWDRCWSAVEPGRKASAGARELIKQYAWPGNVRELRAFAARLAATCTWQTLSTRDVELQLFCAATGIQSNPFPVCVAPAAPARPDELLALAVPLSELRRAGVELPAVPLDDAAVDLPELLRRIETTLIEWALTKAGGNKAAAAQKLGLRRTTLVEKIRRLQGARPSQQLHNH